MHIVTYNLRTLSLKENLLNLKRELNYIKWDVVGESEIRRKGEEHIIPKSGHQQFYKGNEVRTGWIYYT